MVKKVGLQVCYLMGFCMTREINSSEQSLCLFLSFFLFILFFPPNNLIQHSVNSDNKCIFFCMGGRITILLLCKQDVLSGKYSINLAFANGRNPVLQQLCRKSNVLSYSCGIVSISTRAFFCSLSITFPANMRCVPSSLSSVVVSTAIRST